MTKALARLTALSQELAENSGVEDPLTSWLDGMFVKWKNAFLSTITSLCVVATVLVLCGRCCIPCIRGLLQRLIDTALSEPNIQGNQLRVDDEDELEL